MSKGMVRVVVLVALAGLLAGCGRWYGAPPTETGILSYDWVKPDKRPAPDPLYCYETIGRPDCFASPEAGRALLGHYGPTPAAQSQPDPGSPMPGAEKAAEAPPETAPLTPVERAPTLPVVQPQPGS
jgi:hypothetical protein